MRLFCLYPPDQTKTEKVSDRHSLTILIELTIDSLTIPVSILIPRITTRSMASLFDDGNKQKMNVNAQEQDEGNLPSSSRLENQAFEDTGNLQSLNFPAEELFVTIDASDLSSGS